MQTIKLFLLCFLTHSGLSSFAQTDNLEAKLCKTWVAYQEIEFVPMMKSQHTRDINRIGADTLVLESNHNLIRHIKDKTYYGKWQFSQDSSQVNFDLAKCFGCYPLSNERLILKNLTDSIVEMHYNTGKEGEWAQRFFRQIPVVSTK